MKKFMRQSLVATLMLASSVAVNASCVFVDGYYNQMATYKFSQANRAIMQSLVGFDTAVRAASTRQSDAINTAVFVLSNQKATSTKQINQALKSNTHLQASAIQSINQSKRYQKAIREYGKQGLGHNICEVQVKREEIQETTDAVNNAIDGMARIEVTARSGKYANRADAMATRLALHNKYYCTEGQAQAGMCAGAGERAGNSLKASTLFKPADYLSAEYNDKSALINNMVGLPDNPIPASVAATSAGQTYMDMKRRKDALKSPAIYSLKAIQAAWSTIPLSHPDSASASNITGVQSEAEQIDENSVEAPATAIGEDGTPRPQNNSLMVQIQGDVNRYLGGGEEYQQWSKALTGLEEKGVLTEVLRVKALRLYIQTQEIQQLQRMEAMLAANVVAQMENSGISGRVEAQRQRAVNQTIRDNFVK